MEWALLDDLTWNGWWHGAWCHHSVLPFLSLQPQSHAHSSAMSWLTRLSSRKTQVVVAIFMFWPHGVKCGPVNNWDKQCFATLEFTAEQRNNETFNSTCENLLHSGQFMEQFNRVRLWYPQCRGFAWRKTLYSFTSYLWFSYLWTIIPLRENLVSEL